MSRRKPPQKKQAQSSARRTGQAGRSSGPLRIYGIHAVAEALGNPEREIAHVWASENAHRRIAEVAETRGCGIDRASPVELERLAGEGAVHQGVVAEVSPLPDHDASDLASAGDPARTFIVVLDQVTDPHNLGAILRSAAVFGASGLVTTQRHSPPLAGVVAKVASGGLEHVPVALVANLARALRELGEMGVTRIGLDGESKVALEVIDASGPVALILGAEDRGLRRLTAEHCDQICRISTVGALSSLNVSNAAAVALHTVALARR